ncbi:DNA sulfur modification protein DndD [Exiguobacterium sp. SH0S7]|uniref:DNA sulfur modification protein DndD n=1 Tax=Exiguobacterium sp. SH0S7 TaxID=2510951 RepID=UPI00103CE650|nr:DNA sulfur modification protein DndD [Exiguobacterium sp. SH0S7]TCI72186.1 DNA sulfur modification protein DndD [Exiguobacterium sp. SH0S7]
MNHKIYENEQDILKEVSANHQLSPNLLQNVLTTSKANYYGEAISPTKRQKELEEELKYLIKKGDSLTHSASSSRRSGLKLVRIQLNNYKTYLNSQTINFDTHSDDKNIILIGGLNGAGKTTILKAVRYLLYGKRGMTDAEFQQQFTNTINNSFFEQGGREASASLVFEPGDGHHYEIKVVWQYNSKKQVVSESKTFSKRTIGAARPKRNEQIGSHNVDDFNRTIDKLIPFEASQFLIFDGEEIRRIISSRNSADFKATIRRMNGMSYFNELKGDLDKIYSRKVNELATAQKSTELLKFNKKISELKDQLSELTEKRTKAEGRVSTYNKQLDQFKKLRNEKLMQNNESREKFISTMSSLTAQHTQIMEQISKLFGEQGIPSFAPTKIDALKKRLNLEQQYATDQQRVEQILTPYHQFMSKLLSEPIDPPLTEEQLHQVDEIGKAIWLSKENYKASTSSENQQTWHDLSPNDRRFIMGVNASSVKQQIVDLIKKANNIKHSIESLQQKIDLAPSAISVDEEDKKIQEITEVLGRTKSIHMNIKKKEQECVQEIRSLEAKLKGTKSTALNADELVNDVDMYRKIKEAIDEYAEKVLGWKIDVISSEFDKMLNTLMRKQDEFGRAFVDRHKMIIRIENERGAEISVEERSAGEMQIISSAFIWGMIKAADLDLPMIIDTPLGRLDSYHRKNLVEHFYKHLSKQVVILSTDTEITPEYVELMKEYTSKQIMLDYNQKEKYTLIREGYFELVKG